MPNDDLMPDYEYMAAELRAELDRLKAERDEAQAEVRAHLRLHEIHADHRDKLRARVEELTRALTDLVNAGAVSSSPPLRRFPHL